MTYDPRDFEGQVVVGVDEVGRGPLAGPVVAAAVVLDCHFSIPGLNDSKKLNEKTREQLNEQILAHASAVAIACVDAAQIDAINILQATFLAMKTAVAEVQQKIACDWALIDGNKIVPGVLLKQKAIIKGDTLVPSIMAASIVAKVYRDRLMNDYDKAYPHYGFAQHKGYGTKAHLSALQEYGPSPLHRLSFAPLKSPSLL